MFQYRHQYPLHESTLERDKCGRITFFLFRRDCHNIRINTDILGGCYAHWFYRLWSEPDSYRCDSVVIQSRVVNCEYALECLKSGDNLTGQLNTQLCGRNFLFGGVRHISLRVYSTDLRGGNVIGAWGGLGCQDVEIYYYDRESTAALAAVVPITIQYTDTTAAVMRNIKIHFDLYNNPASAWAHTMQINKLNGAGAADNVGRGHILDGLEITGHDYQRYGQHLLCVGAFVTPDVQQRINIHDLYLDCGDLDWSHFRLTLGALLDCAEFSNVYCPKGEVSGANGANGTVVYKNCVARTFSPSGGIAGTDYHVYLNSKQTATGLESVTNKVYINSTKDNVLHTSFFGATPIVQPALAADPTAAQISTVCTTLGW